MLERQVWTSAMSLLKWKVYISTHPMVQGPLQPQNPKNKDAEDPLNGLSAIFKWHIKQINKIEGDFDNKWMPVKHFFACVILHSRNFLKDLWQGKPIQETIWMII